MEQELRLDRLRTPAFAIPAPGDTCDGLSRARIRQKTFVLLTRSFPILLDGSTVSKGSEVGLSNEQWRLCTVRAVTATMIGPRGEDSLRLFG